MTSNPPPQTPIHCACIQKGKETNMLHYIIWIDYTLSLNIRVLILNSNIFFPANFTREKLIWRELDLSVCKLLIEQERDE
jgi:hypothetical protein